MRHVREIVWRGGVFVKNFFHILSLLSLIVVLPVTTIAQANAGFPLVIVVHGIGGGNANPGWSREYADAWGVETHEVTFRYKDRSTITSLRDFVPEAGDWALSVQRQIKDIVRQNPGRRVMIVSHSWGTVVTKMALDGGTGDGVSEELKTQGYHIDPIAPGDFEVEEWVTLGSPLGEAGTPELGGGIVKRRLDVPADRPQIVKHWTNFFDVNDLVSSKSHNLAGASNVKLDSGRNPYSAHTGIWTEPEVRRHIWNEALRISNMTPLRATRVGDVTGKPVAASDDAIVSEYRSLLPQLLQRNKKPWHTRINIVANAEKQGNGYHVDYQTYCLIEKGPDTGKDYVCSEFETLLDLAGIKSAVADMKRQLGK
jgi:hypothetical protein